MAKSKFKKISKNALKGLGRFFSRFTLPEGAKKWILGVIVFVLAIIFLLSFFDLAGVAGQEIILILTILLGRIVFLIPLVLVLAALVFFKTTYEKYLGPVILAIIVLLTGLAGMAGGIKEGGLYGGWLGSVASQPVLKLFGFLASEIIFLGISAIGILIFWHLLKQPKSESKEEKKAAAADVKAEPSLFKKIFVPQFKIKEIDPRPKEVLVKEEPAAEPKAKSTMASAAEEIGYKMPPLDLLDSDKGRPLAGDTVANSAIIKKTLDNFGLKVEMSEVNIGPTVTQYAFKPAEGIKLSKITGLSNNLSLALAAHPIRIEAPIPGKSLVGVEIPNKERCKVRLKDLIANPGFQKSASGINLVLGRDVSGNPCYADLSRMPHLLVAGSTGTGKTIFLNNLIASLLYQSTPATLRMILIDPKRVEFSAYQGLPHLLAPVIFDAQKTVNALRWLVSEMERRFGVLSTNGSRDIGSYNEKMAKTQEQKLPYIVVIVDELADLMAARGREMEAGIVRLAQMARAVGIHLVVATQRPSVEVITGLIKANITSRITFQVASQVDSRTVLDMAGAEKLLGAGDMLFLSAEVVKSKRIQGAFISEKEVKKVIDFIKNNNSQLKMQQEDAILESNLSEELAKTLEDGGRDFDGGSGESDPLYEEAKKVVIESKKASASLLQRRLRVGYARAARLIDILEQKGVVGPGEGARPREILLEQAMDITASDDEGWEKI